MAKPDWFKCHCCGGGVLKAALKPFEHLLVTPYCEEPVDLVKDRIEQPVIIESSVED
jgi:hypothetical protein